MKRFGKGDPTPSEASFPGVLNRENAPRGGDAGFLPAVTGHFDLGAD